MNMSRSTIHSVAACCFGRPPRCWRHPIVLSLALERDGLRVGDSKPVCVDGDFRCYLGPAA